MLDKREFLDRLQMQLADLTSDERREALEYYEEYFADAGEENEADVLISLGSPEQVAEQIKAGLHKADEGMFTENGYREKVESDNPPEIYGRKEENKDTRTQDETGRKSYAGEGAADSRRGGAYQNGSQNGNAMRTKTGGIRMTREAVGMAATDRIRIAGELMNRADADLRDSRTEKRKIR